MQLSPLVAVLFLVLWFFLRLSRVDLGLEGGFGVSLEGFGFSQEFLLFLVSFAFFKNLIDSVFVAFSLVFALVDGRFERRLFLNKILRHLLIVVKFRFSSHHEVFSVLQKPNKLQTQRKYLLWRQSRLSLHFGRMHEREIHVLDGAHVDVDICLHCTVVFAHDCP